MKKTKGLPAGRRGFTLIEILIVIALLMLLLIIVLMNVRNQISKAHDAQRKADLNKIQKSLEEYYNDKQTFPASVNAFINCGTPNLAPYLPKIPCDPIFIKTPYLYVLGWPPATAKDGYVICAKLENKADPDIIRIGCDPAIGCGWSPGYNYCVGSGKLAVNPTGIQNGGVSLNPLYHYACGIADQDGISHCGDFLNPEAAGCKKSYQTSNCGGECQDNPEFRCNR